MKLTRISLAMASVGDTFFKNLLLQIFDSFKF